MLTVELHTRNSPRSYERFAKEIGERHWKVRAAALHQERKGNPLLERLQLQDDAITFQLERLREMQQMFRGWGVRIDMRRLANRSLKFLANRRSKGD